MVAAVRVRRGAFHSMEHGRLRRSEADANAARSAPRRSSPQWWARFNRQPRAQRHRAAL